MATRSSSAARRILVIIKVVTALCCLWVASTGFARIATALPDNKADLEPVTGVVEAVGSIQEGRNANLYLRLTAHPAVFWYPGPATDQVLLAIRPGAEAEIWVAADDLAGSDRVRPWAIRADGATVVFFDEVWAFEWRETRVFGTLTGVLFTAAALAVVWSARKAAE